MGSREQRVVCCFVTQSKRLYDMGVFFGLPEEGPDSSKQNPQRTAGNDIGQNGYGARFVGDDRKEPLEYEIRCDAEE